MSSYWAIICDTCEIIGPQIGRTAGGLTFADPKLPPDDNGVILAQFLIEHEYHDLRLDHE